MLSPHEFATLLLVKDAPQQVEMEREELDALLERQLVLLERLASGAHHGQTYRYWPPRSEGDAAPQLALAASERVAVPAPY